MPLNDQEVHSVGERELGDFFLEILKRLRRERYGEGKNQAEFHEVINS